MDLSNKIRKIEALISGTKSEGERQAAEFAKQRLEEKISAQPSEYSIRVNSPWKKRLFVAVCCKHGLHTYRYKGQKYTTTMTWVSKPFMDQILWPEFNKYAKIFDDLAEEIMNDLISKIHQVDEEEVVISGKLPPTMMSTAPS
ncbi:MAG: hypothetical protein K1000chlam2_00581 [Chlamydiae bacterium]|nr:hypothetical protein [Chlamydiota bacterium]